MDNNHYDGLIIEERINGEWTRIARIGDNNEKRARLENKNRELKHEFRAKAFYFDGSVALYTVNEYEGDEIYGKRNYYKISICEN